LEVLDFEVLDFELPDFEVPGRSAGGFAMRFRLHCFSSTTASAGVITLLSGLALCGPALVQAQVSPNGAQFQINSYSFDAQRNVALAVDDAGRFVAVWGSSGSNGTDDSFFSIQLQRYSAAGAALGGEFQVNTDTAGSQITPDVAGAPAGQFVVVWASSDSSGTDGSYGSVHAQRFDASAVPAGLQFQVNTYITQNQVEPAVASDALGNFVVVWQSYGSSGTDSSYSSVQGQLYDSAGTPVGAEFQVNTYTTLAQYAAAVASDSSGNFVVVWSSGGASAGDTGSYSIQARRYLANGTPVAGEFQVNSYATGEQNVPAVSIDGAGRFVVAWRSAGSSGTDVAGTSIQARRFDANGNPQGTEFQVNTYTTSDQGAPTVTSDAQGNFVVAWASQGSSGTDASSFSTQAQRYRANGVALGGQFQVNSYTTSIQDAPDITSDARGNFVVAWNSSGSAGPDNSFLSIQGQRFDAILRDGFESGGTGRWSAAVP
jgi:hypothetical protein